MAKSCGRGQIRRKSYERKAHSRKSYTRKGSIKVSGSYVNRTHVPSACTKDMGKPGKTPKSKRVLPEPGDKLHLSKYGYSTHESPVKRHNALMKASKDEPMLAVLRRLVLLSNYQADPRAKAVMKEDVDYMKGRYAMHKMSQRRSSRKSSRKGSRKSKSRKESKKSKSRKSRGGARKSKKSKKSKKGSKRW